MTQALGYDFIRWQPENQCPDCDANDFEPGPQAGLCINVTCRKCKSRFNIARIPGHALIHRIIHDESIQ